ncbi:histidine kinase [Shewanella sp. Choline-02u-19]|uniref:PDC sensor domain-containing protein n=1 Tax=unclassified Shewanella TaxID=196818 RepID=UPI000C32709A|nr:MULTISPECIES: cache domain-containing protein [unclassified Shewanella]PKH57084.1 histidine kinase [Shewanella sp. Bg11-22]PKI27881.1 histidine kinase [Shewanella sp. Choline-02u-19]
MQNRKNRPPKLTDWRKSLPMKFMFIQLAVATIIILASVWFLKSIEINRLIDNQQTLNINVGKAITATLQQKTNRIERLAVSISALGELYQHNPSLLDASIPALLDQLGQEAVILGGGVWPEPKAFDKDKRKDSHFWARNPSGKLLKVDDYNQDDNPNYYQENWYIPAKYYPADTTYWSKSYIDPFTQDPMITASVPMWSHHEFIGVSTVDVALSSLDGFFKTALSGQRGYVFALDQQNRLLSFPSLDTDLTEEGVLKRLFQPFADFTEQYESFKPLQARIDEIDAEFMRQANIDKAYTAKQLENVTANIPPNERAKLTALINQNAKNKLQSVQLIASIELDNDPQLQEPVIVTVFLMPGTYWKIILVTPLTAVETSAKSMASSVGLYLVGIQIFALMLLFILQNKLFINPISRMVNALNNSNSALIELESNNRKDEIGMLAKAFSSRTHQLEIALASLDATNLALEKQLEVQQLAQAELKESKEQLNLVLNSAHNLIFIKNINGELTLVNDQFCRTVALNRDDIIGVRDHLVLPRDVAKVNSDNDKMVLTQKRELSYEQAFPSEGNFHTYLVTKFPILNSQQEVVSIGTIAFDITETKKLELKNKAQFEILRQEKSKNIRFIEKLEQTNKRLQDETVQARIQSNKEFNYEKVKLDNQALYPTLVANLVRPIFRQQDELAAKAYRLSNGTLNAADFGVELTEQTERLRHLEYLLSAQDYGAKPIDLVQLLEHIIALLRPKFVDADIDLEIQSDNRLIVDGIHWHFLILFYRLINNTLTDAFDPHQTNKSIKLILVKQKNELIITVYDNGKGFTTNQRDALQLQITENEIHGTISTLSVWLQSEFNGKVQLRSLQAGAQYKTQISCSLSLT